MLFFNRVRSDCAGRIPLLRSSSGSGRFCLEVFIARKAGYLPQLGRAIGSFAEIASASWNSSTEFTQGPNMMRELCKPRKAVDVSSFIFDTFRCCVMIRVLVRSVRRKEMATVPVEHSEKGAPAGKTLMSYENAIQALSSDERFRATVYAMNTLLVQKGIYSPEEFEFQFRQWAQRHRKSG